MRNYMRYKMLSESAASPFSAMSVEELEGEVFDLLHEEIVNNPYIAFLCGAMNNQRFRNELAENVTKMLCDKHDCIYDRKLEGKVCKALGYGHDAIDDNKMELYKTVSYSSRW